MEGTPNKLVEDGWSVLELLAESVPELSRDTRVDQYA
jgi:hypothetical protein